MIMFSKSQSGQSSIELLVSAVVLVPIILLLPTLANFLLAQTEAHKAARYAAWERTAYPDAQLKQGEQLAADIEERFFRYSTSGFSPQSVREETPWRDWGAQTPNDSGAANGIFNYSQTIGIDIDSSKSSTANFSNHSAWLAGKGGPENAVNLNTLQSTKLAVPLRQDNSLLKLAVGDKPEDPITGQVGYYFSSSSALVADGWVPGNEQVFHARVADIGRGPRTFLRWYENNPVTRLLSGVFDEIEEHMYSSTEGTESSFDMVAPNQSQYLPSGLKMYPSQ